MASKDGHVPPSKEQPEKDEAKKDEAAAEASDDGSIDESGAAAAATPTQTTQQKDQTTPTPDLDFPEYTPVAWANKIVNLVKNPPGDRPRESYMLESDDSLSTPEGGLSVPEPSPISATGRPYPQVVPPTSKKHARQESFSSSYSSDFSISSSGSSSSSDDDSPLLKKLRPPPNVVVPSWDSLLLGKRLGSVALNTLLAKVESSSSPQLTSLQTLQLVNSLQLHTIMPPEGSPLTKVVETSRLENEKLYGLGEDSDNENTAGTPNIHFKTLARLYGSMCCQNLEPLRQDVAQLATLDLVERISGMEQTVASLQKREESLTKTGQDLGIMDEKEVKKQLGFWTPLEKYNSRPPPPPRAPVAAVARPPQPVPKRVSAPMVARASGGRLIPATKVVKTTTATATAVAPTSTKPSASTTASTAQPVLSTSNPPAASKQPETSRKQQPETTSK